MKELALIMLNRNDCILRKKSKILTLFLITILYKIIKCQKVLIP